MDPVSVILPVHNEREALEGIAGGVREVLPAAGSGEIIVVDDGSDDGSAELAARLEGVRLVRHEANEGYGRALKTGMAEARHDTVAILDGDGTYDPADLPRLLEALPGADMVVGLRQGGARWEGRIRRLAKEVLRRLANVLAGTRIPDLNSGFRVFRKGEVERFRPILPDGFSFTTTITLAYMTSGRRVRFVPIAYHPRRGASKIRPVRDTWAFVLLILRMILYFNPLKIFLPPSLLLLCGGGIAGIVQAATIGNVTTVPTLAIVTGLQIGAIGLLAELVSRRTQP